MNLSDFVIKMSADVIETIVKITWLIYMIKYDIPYFLLQNNVLFLLKKKCVFEIILIKKKLRSYCGSLEMFIPTISI